MPLHKLSQKSFVNGQYDRTAQNQESVSGGGIVASGLSYAKNVLSSDKGELRKRLGTKFLKQLDGATVIVPFRMPDEDDAILVADTTNIVGYKYQDGELANLNSVTPDATISFPAGNTWGNGTAGGNSVTNGNWTVSFSFNVYDSYPGGLLNGYLYGYYRISGGVKNNAPQSITVSNTNTQSCMRSIKLWFWTDNQTGYIYKHWTNPVIEYSDDGSTWVGVQTDYSVGEYTPVSYTPSQKVNTPQGVITIPANYKSKCSMTIKQTNYGGKHNYWRIYFQTGTCGSGVLMDNVSLIDPGSKTHFVYTSPYTEEQLKNIKYSQDKNEMFIACEGVTPYEFVNNNGQLSLTAFTPMVSTQTIWEINGGYPAAVSLFQNRVWFGGFENNPTKVIASKFDDYDNFTPSSPLQKDDRLDLRCNQLKTRIKNMVGGQNVMCCFSDDGVSYIDGGSTGLLATNENIEFRLKNRMPAGSSTPGFKDDVMLYSSSDGTKLYGVDFDLLVNRFQVSDLAIYAKDVTKDKITELHYVNNESKLVYGLTEAGKMFALLYEKGAYQGFFPLDFSGVIYDIAPVKVGRDYKLLMVVFRDGNWYLEEKLDCGSYIDTSTPRLTSEEKKWATYDNLESNIALDCYQTYDESFASEICITDETHIISSVDLSDYVGKTIMLGNENEKDFVVCTVNSVTLRAAWGSDNNPLCCTVTENPDVGEHVYNLHSVTPYQTVNNIPFVVQSVVEVGGALEIYMVGTEIDPVSGLRPDRHYYRTTSGDEYLVDVTIETTRGNQTLFTKIYPEFTQFKPNLPVVDVAVISEGRYFNATRPDIDELIYLPAPCHKVIYGIPYESLAIFKIQTPYESLKQIAQVDVSVIDTTHLEVGTDFGDTQYIEKIDDSSYYDLTRITMNDTYRIVVSDTPEMTKNVILRSNKGVPFTVNAIDMYISYSNLGGD